MNWDRRPQQVRFPTGTSDGPSARRAGGVGRRIRRGDVGPHRERGCALEHRASGARPVRKTRTLTTSGARPLSAVMSWNAASIAWRWESSSVSQAAHSASGWGSGSAATSRSSKTPRAWKWRASSGFGMPEEVAGGVVARHGPSARPNPSLPAHRHAPQDAVIGRGLPHRHLLALTPLLSVFCVYNKENWFPTESPYYGARSRTGFRSISLGSKRPTNLVMSDRNTAGFFNVE